MRHQSVCAKLFFLLFIFLCFNIAQSQVCSGYEKIKLDLDRNLENKNNDSALYFINKIPKQEGICELEYLTHKIKYYFNTTNYDSAFTLLQIVDQKLAKNPVIKTKIQQQHLYGQYYYYTSLTDSASRYFLKTLELSEQYADTTMQIRSLSSLGNTFANLKQFDKALEYANKALALCITTKNKKTEIYLLGNIMTFYGRYYTKTHNASYLDSAETCSKRLIAEAKKHNKKYELLKAYSVLGSCYFSAKKFDLTLLYSDSILLVADREMHLRPITQAYANICDSYLELGLNKKAKPAADSALVYALKLNDVSTIAESYYRLYDCENMLGNYRNALMYFQKYSSLNDSLKSEDQIQTVNELEQKYSKAKNEKTIKELSQEKDLLKQQDEINDLQIRFLIIAIVFAIVLTISVILFYRQRALKQQQATLQVEQRLNRSRINPHFFFNALGALQNIMLNGTDKPKLVKNFTAFSKLMRQTLESSYNEFISIEKEIEFLDHYLNLQLMRKEGSFEYQYTIASDLETEEIMIPAMLLQPFVENAIEHGFKSFTSGGLLLIDFRLNGKNLVITIDDNGAGIKQKKESDDPTHISRATQITKDRLFLINKTLKVESGFKFIDKFEAGTRVELTLPVLYKHELPHH